MIYYRKTLFNSGPKLTAVQASICIFAVVGFLNGQLNDNNANKN
jgi:hypothetical protein